MEDDGIGDLFDHIEDLLDFPNEKDDDDVLGLVEPCDETGALLLPPPPVPVAADGVLGGVGEDSLQCSSKQYICDELDVVQLEWMSKFFDDSDSFSLDLPRCDAIANNAEDSNAQTNAQGHSFFRTSSPVSVLEANTMAGGGGGESSSSFSSPSSSTTASYFSGGDNVRALPPPLSPPEPPSALAIPSRARSKRSRPATFSPRPHVAIPYLPPSSDVPHPFSAAAASDPESIGEFCPPPPPQKKKKKSPATGDEVEGDEPGSPPPARKCMHCKIEKTPQWRAGPMGPKTLCNACGVRYKTGRLFPEYRPAASPTFVPSLHSNSHKKVVEMRIKASQKAASDGLRPARVHSPEDKHA